MFNKKNFKIIKNKDIEINTYIDGEGPLVIMAHGWPESWYSWRHQITSLVKNGFKVAVPDMRGYGKTSKPTEIDAYNIMELTSDIIAIADEMNEDNFSLIGHDWGAPVAWNTSLYHPDRVNKVCGMSVPYVVSKMPPIETMKFLFKDVFFYMIYFQEEGRVEKELEQDMRKSLIAVYSSLTSDGEESQTFEPKPYTDEMTFLDSLGEHNKIPDFMSEEDFDFYLKEFENGGMRGPINWYRNIDKNWEITKDTHEKKISPPSCFIVGEHDPVAKWSLINPALHENLVSNHIIKNAGHWVQQEKPDEVNNILLDFLK